MTGEITGQSQEVGVFDLNVSAFNLAEGQTTIRLIVNKTGTSSSSVEPRCNIKFCKDVRSCLF